MFLGLLIIKVLNLEETPFLMALLFRPTSRILTRASEPPNEFPLKRAGARGQLEACCGL